MRFVNTIRRLLRDSRGVATSLVEATATITVGAVLVAGAVGAGINAVNDAKTQAAIEDVRRIGEAVLTFYQHNNFFPLFQNGELTGAQDLFFTHLVSANGNYPAGVILTDGVPAGIGALWAIPATPSPHTDEDFSGHQLGAGHDSIEGHLVLNQIGAFGTGSGLSFYPLRGSYAGDRQRGWHGPYVQNLPSSDPWGDKYLINVQELHARHLLDFHTDTEGVVAQVAVLVCSAGENRTIETSPEQPSSVATVLGDDICFRIR